MDQARIGTDGPTYTAEQFEALAGAERGQLKPDLTCPECQADAYFVRRAVNGRPAYFGARPHIGDCELATSGGEGGFGQLEDADAIDAVDAGLILRPMNASVPEHVTEEGKVTTKAGEASDTVVPQSLAARCAA